MGMRMQCTLKKTCYRVRSATTNEESRGGVRKPGTPLLLLLSTGENIIPRDKTVSVLFLTTVKRGSLAQYTCLRHDGWVATIPRDGFKSNTHRHEFGCHYLPHFISNSDTNTNIIEYEYKTDISNSDSHSNTYSIYIIES
jgi:hypothetical protein